jgi:hypothetical protein
MTAEGSCGVLVLSCDRYADLWSPYFESFFRFWPDCPFPVFLAANERRLDDDRVTTLLSGEDHDWSSSVRASVAQMSTDYVLFLYEDAFFSRPVPTELVARHFQWCRSHRANYLRMRPTPRPDRAVDAEIGVIDPGSMYRTSLFASIWRREVVLDVLSPGETPWQFEMEGLRRAEKYPDFFSTYDHVFSYVHGVERGKWFPWAAWRLRRMGLHLDTRTRAVMTLEESLRYVPRRAKAVMLDQLPPSFRPVLVRWKRAWVGRSAG